MVSMPPRPWADCGPPSVRWLISILNRTSCSPVWTMWSCVSPRTTMKPRKTSFPRTARPSTRSVRPVCALSMIRFPVSAPWREPVISSPRWSPLMARSIFWTCLPAHRSGWAPCRSRLSRSNCRRAVCSSSTPTGWSSPARMTSMWGSTRCAVHSPRLGPPTNSCLRRRSSRRRWRPSATGCSRPCYPNIPPMTLRC